MKRSAWVVVGATVSSVALGCGGSSTELGSPAGGSGRTVAGSSGLLGGAGGLTQSAQGGALSWSGAGGNNGGSIGFGGSVGVSGSDVGGTVGVGGRGLGASGGRQESDSPHGGSAGVSASAGSSGAVGTCKRVMSYDVECIKAFPDTRKPAAYFCDNELSAAMWRAKSNWECENAQLPEGAHFSLCCPS